MTETTSKISIPYRFTPRNYQLDVLHKLDSWYRRIIMVRHRRAGKDKLCRNMMINKAVQEVGNYFYIFPTYSQGKKALWDNIDNSWFSTLDHIPKQIIKNKNSTDMLITLVNGSTIQIVGTEGRNIDRLVWTNPKGIVYSEAALQSPTARDRMRPILAVNGWRVVFNSTPRGKNWFYDLIENTHRSDNRYHSILTINDTGILTDEDIDEERLSGMSEDKIQQDYYCSFEASVEGAYYSRQMKQVEQETRITTVPYDAALPLYTFRDLGMDDSTTIWFVQTHGKEVRLIDYYERNGESLAHYVGVLREKSYNYTRHYLPHDAEVRELTSGTSRREYLESMGLWDIEIVPASNINDGIEAVRRLLKYCWFDADRCRQGIRCLKDYHKEWDDKKQVFRSRPAHDWASHGADAFRYLAVTIEDVMKPTHEFRYVGAAGSRIGG